MKYIPNAGKSAAMLVVALAVGMYVQQTSASSGTSTSVLQWQWENPLPSGDYFNTVAYGGGLYIAAGDDGVLYMSGDGAHWTAQSGPLGMGDHYSALYYAGGKFLAVGADASGNTHVSTSTDGIHWTDTVLSLPAGASADQIGYGNGIWILTGSIAETSNDGITWVAHPIASDYKFSDAVYAHGVFIVIGTGTNSNTQAVFYSQDNGQTWTESLKLTESITTSPGVIETTGLFVGNLVSNGSEFILLGYDTVLNNPPDVNGLIYTSPDGVNWTKQPDAPIYGFGGIAIYNGTDFVTADVDTSTDTYREYTSSDGINWTFGATQGTTAPHLLLSNASVAVTPTGYLAVDPNNGPMGLATSSDYVNWNSIFSASGPQQDLNNVFYAQGLFIAAGNGIIMESPDGQTWKTVYTESGSLFEPSTYGNSMYVTNAGTQLVDSSDGINWQPVSIPANSFFYFITYGNGLFVATGDECNSSNCSPGYSQAPICEAGKVKTWAL